MLSLMTMRTCKNDLFQTSMHWTKLSPRSLEYTVIISDESLILLYIVGYSFNIIQSFHQLQKLVPIIYVV